MCHVRFFAYAPPQPILRFESRLDIFCCLWHLVFFLNMSIEIETFLFSFLLYHGLGHRMQTQGLTQDTLFPFFPAVPAICSSNFTTATFLQWLGEIHGSETNVFFHVFFHIEIIEFPAEKNGATISNVHSIHSHVLLVTRSCQPPETRMGDRNSARTWCSWNRFVCGAFEPLLRIFFWTLWWGIKKGPQHRFYSNPWHMSCVRTYIFGTGVQVVGNIVGDDHVAKIQKWCQNRGHTCKICITNTLKFDEMLWNVYRFVNFLFAQLCQVLEGPEVAEDNFLWGFSGYLRMKFIRFHQ